MYPDQYKKIQFETGEIAWIKHENPDFLYLIFADLSCGSRRKIYLLKYKILNEGIHSEARHE